MPTFSETAVARLVSAIHSRDGQSITISVGGGASLGTVTMSMHRQPSAFIDNGQGGVIEIQPVDFIARTSALSRDPRKGDRYTLANGLVFEVQPTTSEKVFRRINDSMTRIHAKQVAR